MNNYNDLFGSNNFFNDMDVFSKCMEPLLNNLEPIFKNYEKNFYKNANPENFLKLYLGIMTNLDARTASVLAYMVMHSDENDIFVGNYMDLMKSFDISRGTLANIMKVLQEEGYIERVKDGYKVNKEIKKLLGNGQLVIKFDNNLDNVNKNNIKPEAKNIVQEQIDADYFKSFVEAVVESKNNLYKNENDDLKAELNVSLEEYLKSESPSFNKFVWNKYVEDKLGIKNIVNFYSRMNNPRHLPLVADFESTDESVTLNNYMEFILEKQKKYNISGETIVIMEELLLNIIRFLKKQYNSSNFEYIKGIMNCDKQEYARIINGSRVVDNTLKYNLLTSYMSTEFKCLIAIINNYGYNNFVLNYNLILK